MTWVKIDDQLHAHPKVMMAWHERPASLGLHLLALSYCGAYLTDGFVPAGWVRMKLPKKRERERAIETLVGVGLWEAAENGYTIHDFLDYNRSKADVGTQRTWDNTRKSLFRDRELIEALRQRDQDLCRYCGTVVDWKNRRGDAGGTYDHIQPRGPNSLDNVVVSCRRCNAQKSARSPEEAGMPLLPAPGSGLDLAS